ncbi:MAG TPA: hypothetical protein VNM22_16415 [Candidatus Limnocylindrales bacterium]|nr:hypothetical protein [Candidatus Limnocylindrales bacterium]
MYLLELIFYFWMLSSANISSIEPDLYNPTTLELWEFQTPQSWVLENGVLALKRAGIPSGPIRKPAEWAILKTEPFTDVQLWLEARCDAPLEQKGRDIILIFGYQSPTRFYYAHLSNQTDRVHNGIFLVNDADRQRIDDGKGIARLMDNSWYTIHLLRKVQTGAIQVYVSDMQTPALSANDTTLRWGRVGIGSFDDTGAFKNLRIVGELMSSE